MEGTYRIYSGKEEVGTVTVSREGLYYCFDCHCRLAGKALCKIYLFCGEQRVQLGTPIPCGQDFSLRTRIPIKQLKVDKWEFAVVEKNAEICENFVSVSENEPFCALKYLKNARFRTKNGIRGIVFSSGK